MPLFRALAATALVAIVVLEGGMALAQEVPIEGLLVTPEAFSDTEVTVTGELIGDYGRRGDGSVWSQLNGDRYARSPLREHGSLSGGNLGIGVRMPGGLVDGLDPPGGYLRRGPLVTATGIWKHHDPDRGGESYLEVTKMEIREPGRSLTDDAPVGPRLLVGALLWVVAGALWLLRRRSI